MFMQMCTDRCASSVHVCGQPADPLTCPRRSSYKLAERLLWRPSTSPSKGPSNLRALRLSGTPRSRAAPSKLLIRAPPDSLTLLAAALVSIDAIRCVPPSSGRFRVATDCNTPCGRPCRTTRKHLHCTPSDVLPRHHFAATPGQVQGVLYQHTYGRQKLRKIAVGACLEAVPPRLEPLCDALVVASGLSFAGVSLLSRMRSNHLHHVDLDRSGLTVQIWRARRLQRRAGLTCRKIF